LAGGFKLERDIYSRFVRPRCGPAFFKCLNLKLLLAVRLLIGRLAARAELKLLQMLLDPLECAKIASGILSIGDLARKTLKDCGKQKKAENEDDQH